MALFAKRLFHKGNTHQHNVKQGHLASTDLKPHISLHYGIPLTSSVLTFDPIQRLLAIGTLDGRIKVIGGDNIEGLLISSKQLPFKNLEFLHNQGYLVSVSNENDIQVWDLLQRCTTCCMQWESNITAFCVIQGTHFMCIGDEKGLMSVLKYDTVARQLCRLPYQIPASLISEAAAISLPNHLSVVGVLPQPSLSGNRVLIVYENGLIILWDISEGRVVLVRGSTDLQLKVDNTPGGAGIEPQTYSSNYEQEEKEICSLCWASICGSVLAVGYIDGDILLWNISTVSSKKGSQQAEVLSNNVVKLQLSSGDRRLPVIVLHWSPSGKPHNDQGGLLFIYGGDDVGSEEVLTVVSVEWSSGIETFKCIARVDLSLNGSFADMILIPDVGPTGNNYGSSLFVLTNPGQLHVYDGASLSTMLTTEQDGKASVRAEQFPMVVPTLDPYMTVSKLTLLPPGGIYSKLLLEVASAIKISPTLKLSGGTKWPLTGGVPNVVFSDKDEGIERLYMAGYQDGSVRIWDATSPVLSLMFALEGEVTGIEMAGVGGSVSTIDFCYATMGFAVGNECGLVRIYKPCLKSGEISFHFVSEAEHEVHVIRHGKGFSCVAALCIRNSPIRALQFVFPGTKLAMGFDSGQVAVVDLSSFTVLFCMECISGSNSPVISVVSKGYSHISCLVADSPKSQDSRSLSGPTEGVLFVLTKNAHIIVIDSVTGRIVSLQPLHPRKDSTAISMHVIERCISTSKGTSETDLQEASQDNASQDRACQMTKVSENKSQEAALQSQEDISLQDSVLLLCCENAIRLYSLKSVIQGDTDVLHKVNLAKPCCWSTIFKTKDEKACGLVILYQTGDIEIRSFPDLELVLEVSLTSILRWSFKTNMAKTMSSLNDGLITLVNGYELAFISLFTDENDNGFGIPDSLPSLHDNVLAAAADAAISFSACQKKKQSAAPKILGDILKGFKGEKVAQSVENLSKSSLVQQLESIFSRAPFSNSSTTITMNHDGKEDLSIDDIEIDDLPQASTSSARGKREIMDEESERQHLFHGATENPKPRMRTPQEIAAKYRKAGDVSSVAADARDKLAQRQEKLERISRRTEELQNGAESFASMASELVKTMEARKWWQL